MSTEAWGDYEVPGSPFFVLVDGASGRTDRRGRGQPLEPGGRAGAPGRAGRAGRPSRHRATARTSGLDGPARESANDDELLARPAILPGDPSLYPTSLDDVFPPEAPTPSRPARSVTGPQLNVATHRAPTASPRPARRLRGTHLRAAAPVIEVDLPGGPVRHLPPPRRRRRLRGRRREPHGHPTTSSPCSSSTAPRASGEPLFARQGMPRPLSPEPTSAPCVLRRGLSGQSGTQWFFTESRPALHALRRAGQPRRGARALGDRQVNALLPVGTAASRPAPSPADLSGTAPWN